MPKKPKKVPQRAPKAFKRPSTPSIRLSSKSKSTPSLNGNKRGGEAYSRAKAPSAAKAGEPINGAKPARQTAKSQFGIRAHSKRLVNSTASKGSTVFQRALAPKSASTKPVMVPAGRKVVAARVASSKHEVSKVSSADRPDSNATSRFPNNSPVPLAPVPTDGKPKKNLAGLGMRDLEHFRGLLLAKRRELVGDMTSMEREALRSANGTNLSNLPLHMADMGTDNYEQEFTLGLVEKERGLLRELNRALAKIQDGTYGICEGTGKPINRPRLEAQPWARFSIEYARMMERGLVRR